MPAGQPLNNAHDKVAVPLLAQGSTQTEVGKVLGVSQGTVSRLAKRRQTQIEALTLKLIGKSAKLIQYNTLAVLAKAKRVLKHGTLADIEASKVLMYLADRKEDRLLGIMGIKPTHTPSMVFATLIQDNRIQIFTDSALLAASAYLGRGELEPDLEAILDAEVEETGPEKDKQGVIPVIGS